MKYFTKSFLYFQHGNKSLKDMLFILNIDVICDVICDVTRTAKRSIISLSRTENLMFKQSYNNEY